MQIGMIGLGRMGGNMVRRLQRGGHECVAYARSADSVRELTAEVGAVPAESIADLARKLTHPRAVWMMVPAGDATEEVVSELADVLEKEDVVVDGGNSYFKDDIRRARALRAQGIDYLDVGTSGGVWGVDRGYCLMIGGPRNAAARLDPVFKTLAPGRGAIARTPGRERRGGTAEEGYLHCGPTGSGHFVKMIHNGIEYGIMQAYAEGFDVLQSARADGVPRDEGYALDLGDIAELWRRGSVIGSWLLDLTSAALLEDPSLERYSGHVQDSGEGRWTIQTAVERAVPADVLSAALYARFRSRQEHPFAEKILSAMREKFGGHKEPGDASS